VMLSSVLSLSLCPLSQCAPFSIKPKRLYDIISLAMIQQLWHMTLLIFLSAFWNCLFQLYRKQRRQYLNVF
jgi:hypothetical protein